MSKIQNYLKKFLSPEIYVQNIFLFLLLVIFFIVYGPKIIMGVPFSLKNLFNNKMFKILVVILIVTISTKNFQLALVFSIIFLITVNIVHSSEVMEDFNIPVNNIEEYNKEKNKTNTIYYPLHTKDSDL